MNLNSRIHLSLVVLLSLVSIQANTANAQTFDLKVEAAIVLYSRAATRKTLPSFVGDEKYYVAKISKVLQGDEDSRYILMLTSQQFAKSNFNKDITLPFYLTRAKVCDSTVENRLYFPDSARDETAFARLLFSKGVKREDVPLDKTLPCYLFRGNDFPNEWWKTKSSRPQS